MNIVITISSCVGLTLKKVLIFIKVNVVSGDEKKSKEPL